MAAESFTLVNVADVHFQKLDRATCNTVSEGNAGMRQATRVDDAKLDSLSRPFLDFVNDRPLVIALKSKQLGTVASAYFAQPIFDVV